MVDKKREQTDRIKLCDGSYISTKEYNLARSHWYYTREKESPESKNDYKNI